MSNIMQISLIQFFGIRRNQFRIRIHHDAAEVQSRHFIGLDFRHAVLDGHEREALVGNALLNIARKQSADFRNVRNFLIIGRGKFGGKRLEQSACRNFLHERQRIVTRRKGRTGKRNEFFRTVFVSLRAGLIHLVGDKK